MEIVLGFLIAATVGVTGIGGGSFTTPALVLLIGLPAGEAVGTAMIFAAALRLLAAPFYLLRRQVNLKYLGLLLLGAVPGLFLGTWILHRMKSREWSPVVILAIGLMLALTSAITFVPRLRRPALSSRAGRWLSLLALPIGIETGFSSAGAGALGAILLLNYSELPAGAVVGTDLLMGIVLGVLGSLFHLSWGSINFDSLLRLLAGGIPGVLLGCAFARRVPAAKLRSAVAMVAIVLGLQLVWMGASPLLHHRSEFRARTTFEQTQTAIQKATLQPGSAEKTTELLLTTYFLPVGAMLTTHCCR